MANIQYHGVIIGKDGKETYLPLLLTSIGKAFQAAEKLRPESFNQYLIKFALLDSLLVAATEAREATAIQEDHGPAFPPDLREESWEALIKHMEQALTDMKEENHDFSKIVWAAASHISNMDNQERLSHFNKIRGFCFQDNAAPF